MSHLRVFPEGSAIVALLLACCNGPSSDPSRAELAPDEPQPASKAQPAPKRQSAEVRSDVVQGRKDSKVEELPTQTQLLTLTGAQIKIFEVAVREFNKTGLDLLKYEVVLYKTGSSHVVLFRSPSQPRSQRGSPRGAPSYSVEVGADYSLIRAHYER